MKMGCRRIDQTNILGEDDGGLRDLVQRQHAGLGLAGKLRHGHSGDGLSHQLRLQSRQPHDPGDARCADPRLSD